MEHNVNIVIMVAIDAQFIMKLAKMNLVMKYILKEISVDNVSRVTLSRMRDHFATLAILIIAKFVFTHFYLKEKDNIHIH